MAIVPDYAQQAHPKNPVARVWTLIKRAGAAWMQDNAMRLAAALAFYTMLSIAPLLIIAVKVIGMMFGADAAARGLQTYFSQMMGAKAASAVNDMLTHAGQPGAGVFATTLSVVILFFSASGVFGELQDAMNTVWEVKPRPGRGLWDIIRERFFSFALVLGTAFLLMVSLVVSTAIATLTKAFGNTSDGIVWECVNFVVSLVIITVLFALIFRYLPDIEIRWRNVWLGALITAALFTVGKFLLGWYLGRGATTSIYGAAGSLVAMLLWVYYSAQILFFGAEFIKAYTRESGEKAVPADNAVRLTKEDRVKRGIPKPVELAEAVRRADEPAGASTPTPARQGGGNEYAYAAGGLLLGVLGGVGARLLADPLPRPLRRDLATVRLDDRLRVLEWQMDEFEDVARECDVERAAVHRRADALHRRIADLSRRAAAPPRPRAKAAPWGRRAKAPWVRRWLAGLVSA